MSHRRRRAFSLGMTVVMSSTALGLLILGCQLVFGIEPVKPCEFHYDNDAGIQSGTMQDFDGGECTDSGTTNPCEPQVDGGPLPCSMIKPLQPLVFVYGSDSVIPILKL